MHRWPQHLERACAPSTTNCPPSHLTSPHHPPPPFCVADVEPHASSTSPWSPSLVSRLIIFSVSRSRKSLHGARLLTKTPFHYTQLEIQLALTHYKILDLPIHSLRQGFCSIRPVCFDLGTRLARFGTEQFPPCLRRINLSTGHFNVLTTTILVLRGLEELRTRWTEAQLPNSLFKPMKNAICNKEHRI